MLSSQLFFKDAALRRRIDDFILLLLLLDDDDDGNKRVVGWVGRLEHEHDAFEEEEEEEDDFSDDGDDMADDDDTSWKVRRSSVKVITALIVSQPDSLFQNYASLAPALILRFD